VTLAPQLRGTRKYALKVRSVSFARPPVEDAQRGVGAHLIYEHEPPSIQGATDECPPGHPQELVSLARTHTPSFGTKPIFLNSLERVDSLTETPTISLRKRDLCLRVTAGLRSTSASRIFLALWSSLGLEPGCFLGVRGLPSRRAAA
jgi:hypothetical protein